MGVWYPWPLSEPEVIMRTLGIDMLASEGCMLITLQDAGDIKVLPVSGAAGWRGAGAVAVPRAGAGH